MMEQDILFTISWNLEFITITIINSQLILLILWKFHILTDYNDIGSTHQMKKKKKMEAIQQPRKCHEMLTKCNISEIVS